MREYACACIGVCMYENTHVSMAVFMQVSMRVVAGKLVVYNRM